jgi:hypothetical protein
MKWQTESRLANLDPMTLSELFTGEDYQLKMRFQRGSVAEFFRPTGQHQELAAQRRFWLGTAARTYAAHFPEADALLEETIALAMASQTLSAETDIRFQSSVTAWERCLTLGESWEPDFLILKSDPPGPPRLLSGCVCFPSSWSLAEKIGRPLDFIHEVVPGLNEQLGSQINGFLSKIKPGISWERTNWGLSRSPELNQHPERGLPRLDTMVRAEEVWLRIEHQSLVALPENAGILFGIRIAVHSLGEVMRDLAATQGLIRALTTMPEPMARYKNLATARPVIIGFLEARGL